MANKPESGYCPKPTNPILELTPEEREMKNLYGDYFEVRSSCHLSPASRTSWYGTINYQIKITEEAIGKRLINRKLIEKRSPVKKDVWIFGWKAESVEEQNDNYLP